MTKTPVLLPAIAAWLEDLGPDLAAIPHARRERLTELADWVRAALAEDGVARLVFICTHNSRRSHLAQAWAAACACHVGLAGRVLSLSGGTESTAFNPRAVRALREAGFEIDCGEGENPRYRVAWSADAPPLVMFSKRFDDAENAAAGDFAAVMTCAEADAACPFVPGARTRIALRYDDPKVADDTPGERAAYAARCRQIAAEMLWAFRAAAGLPAS